MDHPRIVNVTPGDWEGRREDFAQLHDQHFFEHLWPDGLHKSMLPNLCGEHWLDSLYDSDDLLFVVNEPKFDPRLAIKAIERIDAEIKNKWILVYQEGRTGEFQDYADPAPWLKVLEKVDGYVVFNRSQVDYYKAVLGVNVYHMHYPIAVTEPPKQAVQFPHEKLPVLLGGLQATVRHHQNLEVWFANRAERAGVILNATGRTRGRQEAEMVAGELQYGGTAMPWMSCADLISVAAGCFCAIKLDTAVAASRFQVEMAVAGCPCVGNGNLDGQQMLWPGLGTSELYLVHDAEELLNSITDEKLRAEKIAVARQGLDCFTYDMARSRMISIWREL